MQATSIHEGTKADTLVDCYGYKLEICRTQVMKCGALATWKSRPEVGGPAVALKLVALEKAQIAGPRFDGKMARKWTSEPWRGNVGGKWRFC